MRWDDSSIEAARRENSRHSTGSTPTNSHGPDGAALERHAGGPGEVVAERRVVDGLGGPPVEEQPTAVDRRPPAVHALGDVGRHHVGVEVRIEGAARPMDESGGHRPGGAQVADLAVTGPPHPESGSLEVVDGVGHRRAVRGARRRTQLAWREQVEEADRLGSGEHEVEPAHRPGPLGLAEHGTPTRVATREDVGEVRCTDGATESEGRTPPSRPLAGGLAGHTGTGHARDAVEGEVGEVVVDTVAAHDVQPQHRAADAATHPSRAWADTGLRRRYTLPSSHTAPPQTLPGALPGSPYEPPVIPPDVIQRSHLPTWPWIHEVIRSHHAAGAVPFIESAEDASAQSMHEPAMAAASPHIIRAVTWPSATCWPIQSAMAEQGAVASAPSLVPHRSQACRMAATCRVGDVPMVDVSLATKMPITAMARTPTTIATTEGHCDLGAGVDDGSSSTAGSMGPASGNVPYDGRGEFPDLPMRSSPHAPPIPSLGVGSAGR